MARNRSAVIAAIVVALLGFACSEQRASECAIPSPAQVGISVNGNGRVSVVPDVALITLGVEVTAPSVAAARSAAATAMKAVRDSLEGNRVRGDDIQTRAFSIQPQYRYRPEQKPEITGYTVTNRVSVKLRNLDAVSEVLDDAAKAGGDAVRIDGIAFTVDDPRRYEGEAREAAVEDAHERAQQLAKLAGVRLGKVLSISESGASIPLLDKSAERMAFQAAAAPPTPISPGEAEISLSVFVVYTIE